MSSHPAAEALPFFPEMCLITFLQDGAAQTLTGQLAKIIQPGPKGKGQPSMRPYKIYNPIVDSF